MRGQRAFKRAEGRGHMRGQRAYERVCYYGHDRKRWVRVRLGLSLGWVHMRVH